MEERTSLAEDLMPPLPDEIPELCIAELKTKVVHNLITTQAVTIGRPINIERFSTSQKLYRTTAYVLKFVRLLRREVTSAELTLANLSKAERLWIIDAQCSLAQDQNFPKWKAQFSLSQDDRQIWRCGGRLHNANLTYSSKHPVVLPKKHRLSALIAHSAHQRVQHNGVKETLTEI